MVKNRAAIYARFSSHNQRSESIEIQVENSRAYCEREGLQVVREYCDYAQTGRNVNRAEFQRMMNDAKLGLFDFVVIYKELMRKTANSTSTANRAAIQLDTCIVRVSKNWFVVVGTCQK